MRAAWSLMKQREELGGGRTAEISCWMGMWSQCTDWEPTASWVALGQDHAW